jgi:hypothetical protein
VGTRDENDRETSFCFVLLPPWTLVPDRRNLNNSKLLLFVSIVLLAKQVTGTGLFFNTPIFLKVKEN